MKQKLTLFFFLLFSIGFLNAQKLELTAREKEEFKERAIEMINLFKESLTIIPSFSGEPILKDKAIRNTLRLFAKKGNTKIEIAYASGGKKPMKMSIYLNSLRNYEAKRELVNIDIIDFKVDNIEPHPTELGKYMIKYEFVQRFSKKKNFSMPNLQNEKLAEIDWDYIDDTTKKGTAIIEKHSNEDGTKWIMLLGDIEVKDIDVIKSKK